LPHHRLDMDRRREAPVLFVGRGRAERSSRPGAAGRLKGKLDSSFRWNDERRLALTIDAFHCRHPGARRDPS